MSQVDGSHEPLAVSWPADPDEPAFAMPRQVGPYELLEQIGSGGMGIVYRAQQLVPVRRIVALKLIKLGMDTRDVVARFNAEKQTLAILEHPGIAKVFDAGVSENGRPYFVMELVPGAPITEYADRAALDTRGRLEMFADVCRAVQHAHYKGIVHRDLKPSNVLVSDQDDGPAPKIIDFGIAKAISPTATERAAATLTQRGFGSAPVGTPAYMSPEQAAGNGDIDTRTDVYSLGVILYELLTGTLPIELSPSHETWAKQINDTTPPPPSQRLTSLGEANQTKRKTFASELRGDLDWITLKAMDPDRARRYGSASELAEDIRRHLHHEPIAAARPSRFYRARKFVRRNRVLVTATGIVFVALLSGAVLATAGFIRARRALAREATARADAQSSGQVADEVTNFLGDMLGSVDPNRALGKPVLVKDVLERASKEMPSRFKHQPRVSGKLHSIVGNTYHALGMYDDALLHAAAALESRRRERGDDHPETLDAMNNLATILESLARHSEAETLRRELLRRRTALFGAEAPATLAAEDTLGVVLLGMDRANEAEPLVRHALEVRRRILGDEHPDTLSSMNNVAGNAKSLGKTEEAEQLYRAALDGRRRVLGEDSPMTLLTQNNLGAALLALKRPGEAESILRDALARTDRVLGEVHPRTLTCLNNLAVALHRLGKLDESQVLFEQGVTRRNKSLGDLHPDVLIALGNYAYMLELSGKIDEALVQYGELYRRSAQSELPPSRRARYAGGYGLCLVKAGRFDEARTPLIEAKQFFEQAGQGNDPRLREIAEALARTESTTQPAKDQR